MKRLPIEVGTEIFIRPVEKELVKATSTIVGTRHGHFIIIDEPVVRINDRIVGNLEGDLLCWYFLEGDVYRFQSKIQKNLEEGLTLIDYPTRIQVQAIRKSHRIQVNMETRISIDKVRGSMPATIEDISEGGCHLSIPSLVVTAPNTACQMNFELVNGEKVNTVEGVIRSIQHSAVKKTTSLGVQFTGPQGELEKIVAFCQFCMFFKT